MARSQKVKCWEKFIVSNGFVPLLSGGEAKAAHVLEMAKPRSARCASVDVVLFDGASATALTDTMLICSAMLAMTSEIYNSDIAGAILAMSSVVDKPTSKIPLHSIAAAVETNSWFSERFQAAEGLVRSMTELSDQMDFNVAFLKAWTSRREARRTTSKTSSTCANSWPKLLSEH